MSKIYLSGNKLYGNKNEKCNCIRYRNLFFRVQSVGNNKYFFICYFIHITLLVFLKINYV